MKEINCVKYSRELALAAVDVKAIRLQPDNPFTWASGYRMPIYNDNRLFLAYPDYRSLIINAFAFMLEQGEFKCDYIAGIPTAGLPWGAILADRVKKPFIYARKDTKDHGKKKQIEGVDNLDDLKGKNVLVVEDLISTGKSSLESIEVIESTGAKVPACLSIFTYAFPSAKEAFEKKGIHPVSILSFPELLNILAHEKYFNETQIETLRSWNAAAFEWGEKHGFPKQEK